MQIIKLDGYNATVDNGKKLELGTFDSYGEEQLQIVKAQNWENLSVIATFNPPNKKPVQVVVDSVTGVIKVPKEATADLYGIGTIVFVGLSDGVQRISADVEYIVRKHSNANGTEPAEPTPNVVEQILTEAQNANTNSADAKKLATDAKDIAQSVRTDADEGKFNGKDGAKGDKGETGTTPQLKIGEDNLWYVSYDNGETWVSLGVKATGDTGAAGQNGLTPYIGENGNWWVGDTDTGVSAKGPKGDPGPQGPPGEIPEDYPQIREDVSQLKEDLTDVAGTVGIEIAYSGKFVEIEPSEPILADTQWSTQGNTVSSKTSSTMTAGKFPVVSGNKIKLYGLYNGTAIYPLGIFVDENNVIILVVGNTDSEATIYGYKQQYTLASKEALEVTVPEGAKYVLVNGRNKTSGTSIVCPSKAEMYVNNSEQTKVKDIEFSPLYKKKIGFAGDSICYGNGYVGGYAKIIGENNEVTVQNLGIGSTYLEMEVAGSTVITSVNGQRTTWTTLKNGTFDPSLVDFSLTDDYGRIRYAKREWTSKHQYEYTEVTQSEWNGIDSLYIFRNSIPERVQYFDTDCDYIIMEGGINDVLGGLYLGEVTKGFTSELDTHTVLGGTEQMCRNLLARFADKKLGFILIHKVLQLPFTPPPNADGTQKLYFDKIKEVLNKYSIPVLDLYNKSGLNTGMDSFLKYTLATSANPNGDGVHPNEEGYRKFYVPKIEAWLKSL